MEALQQLIKSIMALDDEMFRATVDAMKKSIADSYIGPEAVASARAAVESFKQQNATREQIVQTIEVLKSETAQLMEEAAKSSGSDAKKEFFKWLANITGAYYETILPLYELEHPNIKIFLTTPEAKLPTYAHDGDQGADIYSPWDTVIEPHTYGNLVGTGLRMVIPKGWAVAIRPRSGMSKKTTLRLSNSVATIDSGYLGEVCILFDNIGDELVRINKGDRIAQFIVEKCYNADFEQIDDIAPYESERGEGGFGSSGK